MVFSYLIRSYSTSTLWVRRALLHRPLQHKSLLPPTTMTSLDACLQVARLAEPTGDSVPYLESVAKVAVLVFKLLDVRSTILRHTNVVSDSAFYSKRRRARKVPRSSVRVSQTRSWSSRPSFVCKEKGESSCYIDICEEMEK